LAADTLRGTTKFKWYLAHFLACYTVLLILFGIWANLQYLDSHELPELTAPLKVFVMPAVFSVIGLWLWMLHDYFRERPRQHAVAWGRCLLFFNYGAALVYFVRIWRPRHRPSDT
jgi:hypothetical protein